MSVARDKKHTYLGMDFNCSSTGAVIVSMKSYIIEAIDKFPEEMMNAGGKPPFKG